MAAAAIVRLIVDGAGYGYIDYGLLVVTGAWSLAAALVFTGPALSWLVLAEAIGIAVLAVANLTVHEVTTERVVHTLHIHEPELQTV